MLSSSLLPDNAIGSLQPLRSVFANIILSNRTKFSADPTRASIQSVKSETNVLIKAS